MALIKFISATAIIAVVLAGMLTLCMLAGCPGAVEKGAVEAPVTVTATMPVEIGKTEQNPKQKNATTQAAGRDATAWQFALNLAGSGWAVVATLGLLIVAKRLSQSRGETEAMASGVMKMGPGKQRDRLLDKIDSSFTSRTARKRLTKHLAAKGLRVHRRKQ